MLALWAVAVAIFAWQTPARANQSSPALGPRSVRLDIATRTLEVGEAIDVQLVCLNMDQPEAPKMIAPKGLTLALISRTPSFSQQISTIQGRTTARTEHTYSYRLLAFKAGNYRLGPFSVIADGALYRTKPVRLTVRGPSPGGGAKGDKLIFVELKVDKRSIYVTQTIEAELRIGIRKVQIDGRKYDLNLVRDVLSQRDSEFSIFPGGASVRREVWLTDSNKRRHRYELLDITQRVRAEEVGSITIGPIFVKANYPTTLRRGWFGRYEISSSTKETDRLPAIRIEVKEPPIEGRPDHYTGAIGRFSLNASAKPDSVEQGRPVTLTIRLSGTPIEGVAGPDLSQHPELTSRFDFTNEEMIGELESGSKVFRRAIFPRQPGEQTIPPITWSYFDPDTETYHTLSSDPISLRVEPSSSGLVFDGVSQGDDGLARPTTLTLLGGGLSPNYIDPDAVLANHAFTVPPITIGAFAAAPLAWLVVTLSCRKRAKFRLDTGLARHRRARRKAMARVSKALRAGEADQQLAALALALTVYLADRLNLPPAHVTPVEVNEALSERGIEDSTRQAVVAFLETCDAASYAPATLDSISPQHAAEQIKSWIARIERTSR